jgi:hypothetical protein
MPAVGGHFDKIALSLRSELDLISRALDRKSLGQAVIIPVFRENIAGEWVRCEM